MSKSFSALELLSDLGDFGDPLGPGARLQIETLTEKLRKFAEENPKVTFCLTADGPEQTAAEILAELDAEDNALTSLREAWAAEQRKADQG